MKLLDQINLNWINLQSQLLSFESKIDQLDNIINLTLNASTNIVNKSNYNGNWKEDKSNPNVNQRRATHEEVRDETKAEAELPSQSAKFS